MPLDLTKPAICWWICQTTSSCAAVYGAYQTGALVYALLSVRTSNSHYTYGQLQSIIVVTVDSITLIHRILVQMAFSLFIIA